MDVLLWALLLGVVVLGVFKLAGFLYSYHLLCKKLRKIPQLKSHWLYGNLHQIYDSVTYVDAVNQLVKNERARLYCIWIVPFPTLGTTHPETINQLMKQESRKAKGLTDGYRFLMPWMDGLLISDGEKWERNRKLLTPAFHFDILKGYVTSMNKASDIFLSKLDRASSTGEKFDIFQYTCKLTLDVMLRCSLSYDKADEIQDQKEIPFIVAVRRLTEIAWLRLLNYRYHFDWMFKWTALGREHDRLIVYVHQFTGNLIERRRETLDDKTAGVANVQGKSHLDFLDILLTAKDEEGNGLTDEEIQNEVNTFTFAGHDTTSSAISWTMYALGKYPELQDRVYNEVCGVLGDKTHVEYEDLAHFNYLTMFIKESIRMYPPVPITARRHKSPIVLDGIEIPVGPRIDINIQALHHNENVWKTPQLFDPERFSKYSDTELYSFIPFSAGPRNCIGQNFALNAIKITLAQFVKRFRVSIQDLPEPKLLPEVILKSSNGLFIKISQTRQEECTLGKKETIRKNKCFLISD